MTSAKVVILVESEDSFIELDMVEAEKLYKDLKKIFEKREYPEVSRHVD